MAYVGDEEVFFSGSDELMHDERKMIQDAYNNDARGNPITRTEDEYEPLPPLDIDPSLFEEIVIEPEKFKSRCRIPRVYSGATRRRSIRA